MTDEAETVRAWLTAQRAAIRKQILDLETYREAIDWLLSQFPEEPTEPEKVATSGLRVQAPAFPVSKREAAQAILSVAPEGLTNAEVRAELGKLGISISSGHMGAILSSLAANGHARRNTKTGRYRLVS